MKIRAANPDDAAGILSIYAPMVRDTPVSFEEQVPDTDEILRRIHDSIAWLVCELDGVVAGYAYAGRFHPRAAYRWSAEVSLYVAGAHQRKGIGRRLLGALLDELRRRGFANVLAGIALPNDASVNLFESFGFRRVALYERIGHKLDRWHDVGWWQLRLDGPPLTGPGLQVRRADPRDRAVIDALLDEQGWVLVARFGELIDARDHPALVAERGGRLAGVLTYILTPQECEVLTLHAVEQWGGAGTALIKAVEDIAKEQRCARLFLITTNDNIDALRFYQKRGYELCGLHPGAVDYSRAHLKPEIPTRGEYGIALRDELELEKRLL
jgi:L-amino acid N-acyltransferase YncA